MAYGDYQHCAVCYAKTFYDAGIDWASQFVKNDGYAPDARSVMSLCAECSETHELSVVERTAP